MRTDVPWKPNTTGMPDPFFNERREYLEKLNALEKRHYLRDSAWSEILYGAQFRNPFDPDVFDRGFKR